METWRENIISSSSFISFLFLSFFTSSFSILVFFSSFSSRRENQRDGEKMEKKMEKSSSLNLTHNSFLHPFFYPLFSLLFLSFSPISFFLSSCSLFFPTQFLAWLPFPMIFFPPLLCIFFLHLLYSNDVLSHTKWERGKRREMWVRRGEEEGERGGRWRGMLPITLVELILLSICSRTSSLSLSSSTLFLSFFFFYSLTFPFFGTFSSRKERERGKRKKNEEEEKEEKGEKPRIDMTIEMKVQWKHFETAFFVWESLSLFSPFPHIFSPFLPYFFSLFLSFFFLMEEKNIYLWSLHSLLITVCVIAHFQERKRRTFSNEKLNEQILQFIRLLSVYFHHFLVFFHLSYFSFFIFFFFPITPSFSLFPVFITQFPFWPRIYFTLDFSSDFFHPIHSFIHVGTTWIDTCQNILLVHATSQWKNWMRGRRERKERKRERRKKVEQKERDKNLIKNSLTSKSPVHDNEVWTELRENEKETKWEDWKERERKSRIRTRTQHVFQGFSWSGRREGEDEEHRWAVTGRKNERVKERKRTRERERKKEK